MTATHTPHPRPDYEPEDNPGRLADLGMAAEPLAVQWLVWLRDVKGRRENTLLSYNKTMRYWLQWCERQGVNALMPTLEQQEAFMTRKRETTGKRGSASTQRSDAAALRGWFKWLHERNMLPHNPALDLSGPTVQQATGRPIEDVDWQKIWHSDLPPRLRAILGLGFYCGLRRFEIGGLATDQLTPTRIVRFERKGGGEDTLPWREMAEVHAEHLPHLLPDVDVFARTIEHVRVNYDKVIPWELPRELGRRMEKLCASLDLPKYTPHQLRHSTATNLLRAGLPPHLVMRLMNHTSFDTTMSYVRAGAWELREWRSKST